MIVFAFWTVLTPTAIIIAIGGGAITGYMLGRMFPPNPLISGSRVVLGFATVGFIGLVFFVGQGIEVYFGPEGHLWPRLVARGIVWMIFSAALVLAGTLAQRRWMR